MLIVNEIFTSIDGEVNKWGQGCFSTFIRLAGCNLACPYCDTKYALKSNQGSKRTVQEIIERVSNGPDKVTITGGEPLIQKETKELIEQLLNKGFRVSLETNGTVKPPQFPGQDYSVVMDYKLEYLGKMIVPWESLSPNDYIKIVIGNRKDYETAKEIILFYGSSIQASIYLSPIQPTLLPNELINWILEDHLFNVGINVQLHKLIQDVK